MATRAPIPVICDRCRAEGVAGEGDFADLGGLLDFEPVPRKQQRVDGWTPERQRAFIAALAYTGSPRRAAAAVGKSQWGADRLREAEGAESFAAAWDSAMAIAGETGARRLAAGVGAVAGEAAAWTPPRAPWSGAASRRGPPPEPDEAELTRKQERKTLAALDGVFSHYLKRLEMERAARLAGKVVEADFYVRQITFLEVMIDLAGDGDGWQVLRDLRLDVPPFGRRLPVEVAETPMSRLLDEARREQWAEAGEPERPPLPPPEQLADCGRFSTGAHESFRGGPDIKERMRAKDAEYRAAAKAQVEWEEKARREAAEWRARVEDEKENPPPAPI